MLLIVCSLITIISAYITPMSEKAAISEALKTFGSRVRLRRTELGFSQEELAGVSGLHRTYIGSVERGERNISLANVIRIAAALELDPAELVKGIRI